MRLETYENKETEERVRALLNGRYANTVFCLFDPQGKKRLSRSGRSPTQVMGRWSEFANQAIIDEMNQVVSRYKPKGEADKVVLQDFLSFRQALNVASADQRLLVYVNAEKSEIEKLKPTLQPLFSDTEIIGRFHLDLAGDDDAEWVKSIERANSNPAVNIIRAGKFGMDGLIMCQLPLDTSLQKLKSTLLAANEKFASTEERKVYSSHVMEGNRKGIKFETEIPYGEDLDGDGEIDKRGSRGGSRRGRNQ